MASIDERVVSMTMRSANFVSEAARVLQALTMLKNSLNGFKGAGKGLDEISAAGKRIDLSGAGAGIDQLTSKFSALKVIAMGALLSIGMAGARAAGNLVKSFTISPIIAGLHEYETEMNALQVIVANTGLKGESGMTRIKTALDELNVYADKTIYSFEDMTSAISKFTAAGVGLEDSVSAIKGLANVAAISGAGTAQLAHAQYQLSQALASGVIRLQDWMSIEQADMGGKAFRESLALTAKVHGINVDQMIKKDGNFRLTLQRGWLTSKLMIETLKTLTGDLSAGQLKSMGYSDQQIKKVQELAKAAVDAATKIRTPTQAIATVGEMVQTTWARVWKALFGNLNESTKLFTNVANGLTKIFVGPVQGLATLMEGWGELGGREVLISALTDAFRNLGAVMKSIGSAFRDVFPAMTADRLFNMTLSFKTFINSLKPSAATLEHIHSIFEGLFSGIKLGIDIIKGIFSIFGKMISAATGLGGGILGLVAKIGEFVTHTKDAAESGGRLSNFFEKLGTILAAPMKVLSAIGQVIMSIAEAAGKALGSLGPLFSKIAEGFGKLGSVIADAISSGNFSQVMTAINSVLFGGVLLSIRKFFSTFTSKLGGGGGLLDSIKSIFGGLTNTLQAMQANLNAGTLQKIAIAVGILTVAVVALSMVNAAGLAKALAAISVGMGQLAAMMAILSKIGPVGIAQLFVVSTALNLLATSIVILAGAVAIFAQFSLADLAKGLLGVAGSMAILVSAVRLMGKNVPGVVASAFAMILMAGALNLMATAVRILAGLDWGSLFKGVAAIAALMAIMGAFNKFGGTQLISSAAAMLLLGAALNVIAAALKQLGSMSISALAKGLISVGAGLAIIAVGMTLMPPNMIATASGLLVVSAALTILAKALSIMGGMSWEGIAKSLIVLAGSLVILAAAMMLMTGALPGAAALLVISFALSLLVPVLQALGQMSWGTILTSLGALALTFVLLGAAGILLGPLVPILIGLGAAMVLMGASMMAVGAGVALLGIGLTAIGIALQTSGAAIVAFVKNILALIPFAIQKIGEGIIAFAGVIAKSGPAITKAFVAVLSSLLSGISRLLPQILKVAGQILQGILNVINKYGPQIINTFLNLLGALLSGIARKMPQFVQKGIDIVVSLINGIARNMGRIVNAGVNAVVGFINGVAANLGRIINAGIRLAISFINGVANGIRNNTGQISGAANNLGNALVQGVIAGIGGLASGIVGALVGAVKNAIGAAWNFIKGGSPARIMIPMGQSIVEGLSLGLTSSDQILINASEKMASTAAKALQKSLSGIDADIGTINPVITPVIDLSEVRRGYDDLYALVKNYRINTSRSSIAAATIGLRGAYSGYDDTTGAGGRSPSGIVTFIQNNNSPKALSSADIYRQTKNQLSALKGGLP